MREIIKNFFKKNGIEICRYPRKDLKRRLKLLETFNIDVAFDIGAHTGQYAMELFDLGFKGRIISFEPLSIAYKALSEASANNEKWTIKNIAVGNKDGEIEINVSQNLFSSSILAMLPEHLNNAPDSKYIDKEKVKITKIDSIFSDYVNPGEKVFVKLDTQGYEKIILDGAINSLDKIAGIQLEMSLVSLYDHSILFQEMIAYLQSKNFKLYSLENGFASMKTGQQFQVDGIFFKEN